MTVTWPTALWDRAGWSVALDKAICTSSAV